MRSHLAFTTPLAVLSLAALAAAQQPAQKPAQHIPAHKLAGMQPSVATVPTLPSGGFLGANDDCATPNGVVGPGVYAFDNSTATTGAEGQNESLCFAFGTSGIDNDVWFTYTAGSTGTATVTLCAQTTTDTKLAAYPGAGCPVDGTALACNDDTCSLQSEVMFATSAGGTYTLQLGTFPGASGGSGTFTISELSSGPANDECTSPEVLPGAGVYAFDLAGATTGAEGQDNTLCYAFGTSGIDNDLWYSFTADCDGSATFQSCGLTGVDTKIAAYAGAGCPGSDSAIACNDDTCSLQSLVDFGVSAGSTYTLQLGTFPGGSPGSGQFMLDVTCDPVFVTSVCSGDGSGTPCPCGNAGGAGEGCGNSTGVGGLLGYGGEPSVSNDTLELIATQIPANIGLFFQGQQTLNGGAGFVFGDGLRCCGEGSLRLVVTASGQDADGNICASTQNGQNCGTAVGGVPGPITQHPANNVNPGDKLCYQYWYRDTVGPCASGFNLTNALEVDWQP